MEILHTLFLMATGIVPLLLFCCQLKRRKYFWLHLVAAIVLYSGLNLLVMFVLNRFFVNRFWLHSFVNIVIFMAMTFMMWLCFSEKYFQVLFCCVAGKSTMHLAEYIRAIPALFIDGYVNVILSVVIYAAVYVVIYFVFARRLKREGNSGISNIKIVLFTFAILLVTDILLMDFTAHQIGNSAKILFYVLVLLICLMILFLQFGLLTESKMKREVETIQQLREKEREQYEISRETIKLIGIKHHDIKAMLESGGRKLTEEEEEELRKSLEECDVSFNTGNKTLDVVLTEKFIGCRKLGIRLECLVNGAPLDFMSDMDIYSLFLNAINNAVECTEKIEDEKKRVVWLKANRRGEMLFIQVQNYYHEKPVIDQNGFISTTKEGKGYHGYGLQSMKMIAEKYGGSLSVQAENGIFSLGFVFPTL